MRKIIYLSLLLIVISVTYAIQEIQEVGCMSGDKFVGNWANGKKHGKGIIYYTSGEVKKGLWIEGELFGTE